MSNQKVTFTLTGDTPLLMHMDNIDGADELKSWKAEPDNRDKTVAGDDRAPAWTWMTYIYHDGEQIAWPSPNLMVCLRQAASKMSLKGNKTYKEASQAGLAPLHEFFDFFPVTESGSIGKPVMVQQINEIRDLTFSEQRKAVVPLGFTLDVRRAAVNGKKHIRVRPRFDQWVITGQMEVLLPDILTPEVITRIFDLAGSVGLGDWRPGSPKSPGAFGKFTSKVKLK